VRAGFQASEGGRQWRHGDGVLGGTQEHQHAVRDEGDEEGDVDIQEGDRQGADREEHPHVASAAAASIPSFAVHKFREREALVPGHGLLYRRRLERVETATIREDVLCVHCSVCEHSISWILSSSVCLLSMTLRTLHHAHVCGA